MNIHADLLNTIKDHSTTFGHEGTVMGMYSRLCWLLLDGKISEDAVRELIVMLEDGIKFHNDKPLRDEFAKQTAR
jgi:ABC-type transport system substrate-binding protein